MPHLGVIPGLGSHKDDKSSLNRVLLLKDGSRWHSSEMNHFVNSSTSHSLPWRNSVSLAKMRGDPVEPLNAAEVPMTSPAALKIRTYCCSLVVLYNVCLYFNWFPWLRRTLGTAHCYISAGFLLGEKQNIFKRRSLSSLRSKKKKCLSTLRWFNCNGKHRSMKLIRADGHLARRKPVCIRLDEEENGSRGS